MFCRSLLSGFVLTFIALPALAQVAATPVPAPAKPADYAQRLDLSKKIDTVAPAGQQIDNAIAQLSQRVPLDQRAGFVQRLNAAIDKRRLEAVSIDAMAQVYTVPELQRMYDYMSAPEAKSIAEKSAIYEQLIKPEIIRELDKGVMDAKVGASAAASQNATPMMGMSPANGQTTGTPIH